MEDIEYAIVCVDDDPYILQMLSFQLAKIIDQRYTLMEYYTDPNEALEKIDDLVDEKLNIIFTLIDFQMPSMSGADLIKSIKNKYPDLKCVMLSGQAHKKSVMDLKKNNLLENFIHKPWSEDDLFNILRPILLEKAL